MGLFSGLARGLGSAAVGYGKGQRQGEQEAYNRYKTDELSKLRLLASQKQVKQDPPYAVKSLIDTHRAVMSAGNPEHIRDWIGSGNAAAAEAVGRAWAEGGDTAALQAYGIATAAKGTDTTSQQARLAAMGGGGVGMGAPSRYYPHPTVAEPTGAGQPNPLYPHPAPDTATAAAPRFNYVQPSIDPNYQYNLGAVDTAHVENLNTNTARTEAMTPFEIAKIDAQTGDIWFQQGLSQRKFNLEAGQSDWDHAMKVAQFLAGEGHKDLADQVSIWAPLLSASVKAAAQGGAGNVATALKPFLFQHREFGRQVLNSEAASRYLQLSGVPIDQIPTILSGLEASGLKVQGGPATPGAPTAESQMGMYGAGSPAARIPEENRGAKANAAVAGGPPTLPPVGGATQNAGLVGAENFAGEQGFKVTSTTGGQHNPGSLHPEGRALDAGVRDKSNEEVKQFMVAAKKKGYIVRDERIRPKGQKVWSGPHIHIEWAGHGPPPDLPGMTSEQIHAAMNPNQDVNAGPNAAGINTPATAPAPQNPWKDHPESLEGQIWDKVTKGVPAEEIMNKFRGTPYETIAQHVVSYANTQQREGLFHGIPVADRFGARAPDQTNFAGTLGYKDVGIPQVTTSPVEPTGGFGPGTPTPRTDLPPTPVTENVPPDAYRASYPPPAGPAPTTPPPSAPPPSGAGITIPQIELPAGPPLMGTGGRGPGGPSATEIPATPQGAGPSVAGTKKYQDLVAGQPKVTAKPPADRRADKNVQQELSRYKKHELAPGVQKWLGKHKIGDPKAQRQVYQYAIGELGKEVASLPKGERAAKMFRLLEQRLKPAS